MNKILTTTFASIMTILLLTLAIASPITVSEDDSDDTFGTEDECAKKYNTNYNI